MAKVSKIHLMVEKETPANSENKFLDEINIDISKAIEDNEYTDDENKAHRWYRPTSSSLNK